MITTDFKLKTSSLLVILALDAGIQLHINSEMDYRIKFDNDEEL
jgi:hypothetical protein